jgi:hypothetical protein
MGVSLLRLADAGSEASEASLQYGSTAATFEIWGSTTEQGDIVHLLHHTAWRWRHAASDTQWRRTSIAFGRVAPKVPAGGSPTCRSGGSQYGVTILGRPQTTGQARLRPNGAGTIRAECGHDEPVVAD